MSNEQDVTDRAMAVAANLYNDYFLSLAKRDPIRGLDDLQETKIGAIAYVFEVALNLGIRNPEQAREIIKNIEWGRTECVHPKDEYCVPTALLNDMIGIILQDEWPEGEVDYG